MNIKEVCKLTGFNAPTLRYYEQEGIIRDIKKNDSGHRFYNDRDLKIIKFIKILKELKMKNSCIKYMCNILYEDNENTEEKIKTLLKHRKSITKKIEDLQNSLSQIDKTITKCYGSYIKDCEDKDE